MALRQKCLLFAVEWRFLKKLPKEGVMWKNFS